MAFVRNLGAMALLAAACAAPVAAAEGAVEVRRAEALALAPGGRVVIDRTWGSLSVEGWDRPSVEVTVTARSKKAYPDDKAAALRERLARFGFESKAHAGAGSGAASGGRVTISGLSPEAGLLKPFGGRSGVSVAYTVRMPRTATLELHHDMGEVSVKAIEGDVDVASRIGDVRVAVPLDPSVAVESSARVGEVTVSPALRARGEAKRSALVGGGFRYAPAEARRHVVARVGVGSVAID